MAQIPRKRMTYLLGGLMASVLLAACEAGNEQAATEIQLPPSFFNDPVLGPLPMVSLDPLGESAGRLEGEAEHPDPDSYGYDRRTGVFTHPAAAPEIEGPRPFIGSLTYIDMEQYSLNTEVVAFYPYVASVGHTYQFVLEFDGRRYMYNNGYPDVHIYDITDPRDLKVIPSAEPIDSGIEGDGPVALRGFFRYVPRLDKYYVILFAEICIAEIPRR